MLARFCTTAAMALALSVSGQFAQAASLNISGKVDAAYTKKDTAPLVDEAHPVLMSTSSKGVNAGAGPFNGFAFNVMEVDTLTRGSGRQEGVVSFTNGSDATINKIVGDITTTIKDGQPVTTFHGKWRMVEGVGKFKGAKGEGVYSGTVKAGQDGSHVDWQGRMTVPANVAAR